MLDAVTTEFAPSRSARLTATLILPLFAATLFAGSFLLFLVEPMVAKMVLPVLGGAPMVWNTCVVFFQGALLAGYGYAYGAARSMAVRRHVVVQVVLLALPLASLPFLIGPGSSPSPESSPVWWLLGLLTTTIGLPFLALSTNASVLQHWFARSDHASARDPYFLYGASNLGSLLALAAYPTIIEPTLPLRVQSRWWAAGYAVFVGLTCVCAVVVRLRAIEREEPAVLDQSAASASIAWARRGRWLMLAFVPSSLMLAVTSYITTDVAAVPLLWILPLGIYLGTFILAFGKSSARARAVAARGVPIVVVLLAICMVARVRGPLTIVLPLHLGAFALLALQCHCALAADRPAPARLTEFYFWISLGGMIGGLFNVLVAPLVFSGIAEYPLVIVIGCLLAPTAAAAARTRPAVALDVGVASALGVLTAVVLAYAQRYSIPLAWLLPAVAVPALAAFAQRGQPRRFAAALGAILLAAAWGNDLDGQVLHAERTFFGVYRVMQDGRGRYHALAHGTTLHGMQALDPARRGEPLTYFHRTGPFGQAFAALPRAPRQVAVVGLGIGTLAAYATPGQEWTFYEIDPAVERIARNTRYFFFLDACGDRCRVVLGDARLSLATAPDRAYDLLVLDAFSSDAIPMHLVTAEAFSLYLSRLAPGGVIAFHISNRHLQLGPVIGRLAASQGLVALAETDLKVLEGKSQSRWVVMARSRDDLGGIVADARWAPPSGALEAPLWTDEFSNILSVLSLR